MGKGIKVLSRALRKTSEALLQQIGSPTAGERAQTDSISARKCNAGSPGRPGQQTLHESEPDLNALPSVLFTSISRLADAEVVSHSDFITRVRIFRALDHAQLASSSIPAAAAMMSSAPLSSLP
jgi:hypothetical protein